MEYARGGELKRYVQSKNGLKEVEAMQIMTQIFNAIYYWHQQGIVHRDLKLENILFSDPERLIIKVVDFGLSGFCRLGEATDSGTLKYMAPEVLSGMNTTASKSIDVWSLGIILYALLFNGLPFLGDTKQDIIKGIIDTEVKLPESYEDGEVKLISNNAEELIKSKIFQFVLLKSPYRYAGKRPQKTDITTWRPNSPMVQYDKEAG